MSIAAVEYTRKLSGLKITEKFVLTTIAHYLNSKSNVAWPSIPTLAADCGMSERSIYRSLASLAKKNHITHEHLKANYRNIYQMPGFDAENNPTPDRMSPVHPTPDRMSPVTPDRMAGAPLTETTITPDRVSPPNKEERDLLQRERQREQNPSLSLQRKETSTPPDSPQVFDWNEALAGRPAIRPGTGQGGLTHVFNWQEYIKAKAQRGRLSKVEERAIVNDLVMEADFRAAYGRR